MSFVYKKDSRDDEHLVQLFSLLGPLPAKLKDSWPRYGVYFDDVGQLTKFDVDDDDLSYPEFENLFKEDSRSTASDKTDVSVDQEDQEVIPIALPGHLRTSQELFDPELYPSLIKVCDRKISKDQDLPESLAEYTALNPPLREIWLDMKHTDMELEESELVLDLSQGLLDYDPDRRLSTKEPLQHA